MRKLKTDDNFTILKQSVSVCNLYFYDTNYTLIQETYIRGKYLYQWRLWEFCRVKAALPEPKRRGLWGHLSENPHCRQYFVGFFKCMWFSFVSIYFLYFYILLNLRIFSWYQLKKKVLTTHILCWVEDT